MKNRITIITPFYPINHRNDLYEDTKAVYYLLKELSTENDIVVIHSFIHSFRSAWKHFFKVIPIKKGYSKYLHSDDYGNRILFFENILFIPKSIKILNYFNNKYASIYKKFSEIEKFNAEVGVVHFPTYYVDFINKLSLNKKIAIIHSFDLKIIKKHRNTLNWNKYFASFDAIGFRSFVIKKEFEKLLGTHKKTFMCLSGIPEEYIYSNSPKNNLDSSISKSFLYAGRLDKNKNVAKSILALNYLDKAHPFSFTIIGEGEEKKHLKKMVKNLNLEQKIQFTGKLSREETFELMQKADIFIMVSRKETLGLVYLEAMAAGCIVIGTKGQGIDGIIVDGKNGFLTDSNSEIEIYKTINRVISLPEKEYMRIRQNAKETVNAFIDSKLSKEYYSNICSVIEEEE